MSETELVFPIHSISFWAFHNIQMVVKINSTSGEDNSLKQQDNKTTKVI